MQPSAGAVVTEDIGDVVLVGEVVGVVDFALGGPTLRLKGDSGDFCPEESAA